jgi:hypothetical protein
MLPFPVVKHLNLFKAHVSNLVSRLKSFSKVLFVFETVELAFRHYIVPAVSLSARRTSHYIFLQQRLKGMARVLTSPVRVVYQARRRPTPKPGHAQCSGHDFSCDTGLQRPAYDLAAKQVQNDG